MSKPNPDSLVNKVGELLKQGPLTIEEIQAAIPGLTYRYACGAARQHGCKFIDGKYHHPSFLKPQAPKALGSIVPARKAPSFRPLKGYVDALTRNLREPVREIGFKSASPSVSVYWNE